MDKRELLERYEALGAEQDFATATRLYEQALLDAPTARLFNDYGYLLECHARNELRRAAEQYEQAIRLDPSSDKPHFQLISAHAGLQEPEVAVARYERRLAATPDSLRDHRFLSTAHLQAHAYDEALRVIQAGLGLAPDDAALLTLRGRARAGLGDPDGARADWRRALEADSEDISPLYSTASLLEREGRPAEARAAWQAIITWHESRGHALQAQWPKRELDRLSAAIADG
jgi:tetratricopeptide (TPR) repeat protein